MKPEDLMVGDWVLLWGDNPARVDCIGNVEVYLTEPMGQHELDWRVTYEHIKPIPLTPEILSKNEFYTNKKDESVTRLVWADNRSFFPQTVIEFSFYNEGNILLCWTQSKNCDIENSVHIYDLKNVHELQHALKLCGIDKEIVL